MFSCFRKSHGLGRRKDGHLGHLWGRLVCLLTHVWSSSTRKSPGQEDLDRLFKPLKFDYKHPDFVGKLVSYLPKALKKRKYDFLSAFLAVYPVFASTREVLELLTNVILDILLFLIHWIHKMPEDFRMAPEQVTLKTLVDFLCWNLPLKFYQVEILKLLSELEAKESKGMLEDGEEARNCRFCRAEKLLAPMPDATEVLQKLRPTPPTPPCVAGPRGDLTPKEDTEIAESAVGGPTLPEDGPEQLKHTSADSVDVIIHILAAGHTPAAVPVVPLPDVDV
ncbi:uncharacterized protein [Alexandromys fortis]|uniref:uncharacterized protein n=1 Tax=Alexandromys fortis TaxID=100897 RepID=UPI002152DD09|nr:uncharacterized protein LOC126514765 [Microtus fortis]